MNENHSDSIFAVSLCSRPSLSSTLTTEGIIKEFDAENAEDSYAHRRRHRYPYVPAPVPEDIKPLDAFIGDRGQRGENAEDSFAHRRKRYCYVLAPAPEHLIPLDASIGDRGQRGESLIDFNVLLCH
jgi:hypothetical protein